MKILNKLTPHRLMWLSIIGNIPFFLIFSAYKSPFITLPFLSIRNEFEFWRTIFTPFELLIKVLTPFLLLLSIWFVATREKKLPIIALIINSLALLGVYAANLQTTSEFNDWERWQNHDVAAFLDLRNARSVLESYYTKFGQYPEVVGSTADERWISLSQQVNTFGNEYNMPQEEIISGLSYDYQRSPSGQSYVLAALMGGIYARPDNVYAQYDQDLDGLIYGIDCNDPIYCVGPRLR